MIKKILNYIDRKLFPLTTHKLIIVEGDKEQLDNFMGDILGRKQKTD